MSEIEEIYSDTGVDIRKINQIEEEKRQQEVDSSLQSMYEEQSSLQQPVQPEPEIEPEPEQFQEVIMSPEEIRERSELLSYIHSAKTNFPDKWTNMGIANDWIENATNDELRVVISDYKFRRDSVSSFQYIYEWVNRLILLTESFGASVGLELGGLSERLKDNNDFQTALKELIHDNQSKFHLSPFKRVCLGFVTTAAQVHQDNVAKKIMNNEYEAF